MMPQPLATLRDYERQAQKTIDPATWAYFNGGAGDEITLHANSDAWQKMQLRPRVLRSLAQGHTRISLFEQTCPSPLLIAPMAFACLAHAHAESGMAMAAAAQGVGMVLSSQSSETLEAVASRYLSETSRGPLWFQLYWQACEKENASLIERAESAGYQAIVLTVDAPIQGVRDAEIRAGFKLPAGVRAVNLPYGKCSTPHAQSVFGHWMPQAPSWQHVRQLCQMTRLPVLLKGITHPKDAELALQHGVSGIVVSNHGGRVLDTTPSTASVLPEVLSAVQNQVPVLVDGGIRRGADIFKALALGAEAVLLGRPALYGLACHGAQGVSHVLRLMLDEFEACMALCGCEQLSDIETAHVQTR